MMGMILISVMVLTLLNIIDISTLMNETSVSMFMVALLSVGLLDVIAGIILSRR